MNNHKDFATHNQALALRELGFDEPCLGYWSDWGTQEPFLLTCELGTEKQSCSIRRKNFLCSAPTYSQAFRFFREKYRLPSWIEEFNGARISYHFVINSENEYKYHTLDNNLEYKSHEEAESACLDKLIEIVKA